MARRILNRKELRADYDAAERRKTDEDEVEGAEDEAETDEEEEEEKGQGEDEEGEAEAEGETEAEAGAEDEEAEVKPKPKKKKAAPKPKAKPRSRAAKVIRMRVMWGVFNNSNQCVATYEYPKRKEAEAHAAKLMGDKKSTHFIQPVKEPIEEKKEE